MIAVGDVNTARVTPYRDPVREASLTWCSRLTGLYKIGPDRFLGCKELYYRKLKILPVSVTVST